MCDGYFCDEVATESGMCAKHIRALKLSTKIQDAVLEFLRTRDEIWPGGKYDECIKAGGECIAIGMGLLIEAAFDYDVVFSDGAICSQGVNGHDPRWRVNFAWKLDGEEDE
jgi:hypothetical protein